MLPSVDEATFVFQIDITTLDKKTETRIEELTFNAAGKRFCNDHEDSCRL